MTERPATGAAVAVDVLIAGGGVAGLWLLGHLRRAGYRALLVEPEALGAGQTRHAQGIIHGGTKYALTGSVSAASEAIAAMPAVWRDCLAGRGAADLRTVQLLSDHQYLWSTAAVASRLAGFFASRLMRSRMTPVARDAYPPLFAQPAFSGQVYRLEEPVLEMASLVHALAEPHRAHIWRGRLVAADGLRLTLEEGGRHIDIEARQLVLAAGRGTTNLLRLLGRSGPAMQLRPLKMVMLRGHAGHDLPAGVYAHCLGASANPRLTISSHLDGSGRPVWYLGGDLAETGVRRSDAAQRAAAAAELTALLPWLDLSRCTFATLDIDRAEPRRADGRRPEDAFAHADDGVIVSWPVKLALAPRLAQQVEDLLRGQGIGPAGDGPAGDGQAALPAWPFPGYAALPWQEEERWRIAQCN